MGRHALRGPGHKVLSTLWQTRDGVCCLIFRPDSQQLFLLETFDRSRWDECEAGAWLERLEGTPGLMPGVLQQETDRRHVRIVSAVPPGGNLKRDPTQRSEDASKRLATGLAQAIGRLHAAGFIHGALQPAAIYEDADRLELVGPGTVAFHSAGGGNGPELAAALGPWAAPELETDSPDSAADYFALGQLLKTCCPCLPQHFSTQLDGLLHPDPDRRALAGLLLTSPPRRTGRWALIACAGVLLMSALAAFLFLREPTPKAEAQRAASSDAGPQDDVAVREQDADKATWPVLGTQEREKKEQRQPPEVLKWVTEGESGVPEDKPEANVLNENGESGQPVEPVERATEPEATPVVPADPGVPAGERIAIPTDHTASANSGDDTDTDEDLALTTKELLEQPATSKKAEEKPAARPPDAAPVPHLVVKKPAFVEMVFVIDTTGSMGGLIKSATEKIWFIINEVASAHPAPEIRIGFVIYRDVGDEYVTKVYPMEEDFNYVVENMDQFKAGGGGDGPEHVSLALQDAVTKMNWSKKGTGYRVIFLVGDAPPHTDYKDGANYKTACQQAVYQRIIVNAIRCGTNTGVDSFWREIAKTGYGQFLVIPQDGGAASIPTPVDAQIGELVDELEAATLPLPGREADQQRNAKVTAGLSAAAKADKGCLYTKTTQQLIRWDFITACAVGRVRLDDVPDDKLPEALRALPKEERARFVAERVAKRKACVAQIARLEPARRQFIAQAMAKVGVKGTTTEGFDNAVIRTIRLQGSWFGLKW